MEVGHRCYRHLYRSPRLSWKVGLLELQMRVPGSTTGPSEMRVLLQPFRRLVTAFAYPLPLWILSRSGSTAPYEADITIAIRDW
jgi:hypothetical protein